MARKIIVCVGLQGSGKSTWSLDLIKKSNGDVKRINNDDLRSSIDAGIWSKSNEKSISEIEDTLLCYYLEQDKTVVIDNVNLHPKHIPHYKLIAEKYNADFEINDSFLQVPLEECIKRDSLRPNPVGRNVIMQMYNQYLKPEPPKYNPELQDCIVCDLDGTLCLLPEGCNNWYDRDFTKDIHNELVLRLIKSNTTTCYSSSLSADGYTMTEYITNDPKIIFISGRQEKFREQSETWIREHLNFIQPDEINLFMRSDSDNRGDEIVKKELYEQHIKNKYNVKFIVDDRPKVVRMWRSLGLFVFDVNQRNEEF